jgi:hypothetical protein
MGEMAQLTDGLLVGGQIVIGGSEANIKKAHSFMAGRARMGRMASIKDAVLDPDKPTTFDTPAIVQLLLIQANETFHSTADTLLTMIQDITDDGHDVSVALQLAREQVNAVHKL